MMCVNHRFMPVCKLMVSYVRSRARISSPGARTWSTRAVGINHSPQALGAVVAFVISANATRRSAIRRRRQASDGNGNEGSTPALVTGRRANCSKPAGDTLKGVRDRAILATLLYHGIRREELCRLRVKDLQSRQGVMHFRVKGKRDKIRCAG